jgi:hypothetical protein
MLVQDQPRQKLARPRKKLDVVVCTCHLSYIGNMNMEITVQNGPGKKKCKTLLKNN